MAQRRSGVAVLVLAVLLALVVPVMLHGGVVGRPTTLLIPPPPHVGGRIDIVPAEVSVVPCDALHDAEVTARWTGDDQTRPRDLATSRCGDSAAAWAGSTVDAPTSWPTTFEFAADLVQAPAALRFGGRDWSACTVSPASHERYSGSTRGAAASPERPAAFGRCEADGTTVGCLQPHNVEFLSPPTVFDTNLTDRGSSTEFVADLSTRCARLAALMMNTTDPTRDGALLVAVMPTPGEDTGAVRCTVRVTGDRLLDGSVFGTGADPLPFA